MLVPLTSNWIMWRNKFLLIIQNRIDSKELKNNTILYSSTFVKILIKKVAIKTICKTTTRLNSMFCCSPVVK